MVEALSSKEVKQPAPELPPGQPAYRQGCNA